MDSSWDEPLRALLPLHLDPNNNDKIVRRSYAYGLHMEEHNQEVCEFCQLLLEFTQICI